MTLLFILFSLLGAIAFHMARDARSRLERLEQAVRDVEGSQRLFENLIAELRNAQPTPRRASEPAPAVEAAPQADAVEAVEPETPPETAELATETSAPGPRPRIHPAWTTSVNPAPQPSLEEQIGTRWVVYLGGVALALGGLLLARYAFDQGYFGPAARIVAGLFLSVALIAAGEKLRRREAASGAPTPTPAVLTAAGTTTAFGVIYAAHALYGFIGPSFAFVALGATALATLLAALLHGPAIAGLGIVGALGAPLLIESAEPTPWSLAIYVAIVVSSSYALARLRQWAWLAITATVGAAVWGCLLNAGRTSGFAAATELHFAFHTAMAVALYALGLRPLVENLNLRRQLANLAPSLFAFLAIFELAQFGARTEINILWGLSAAAILGVLAYAGSARPAFAPILLLAAGAANLELLWLWPRSLFPDTDVSRMGLFYPGYFYAFAVIGSSAIARLSGRAIWKIHDLPRFSAAILASAAALTPLAALWISHNDRSDFEILRFPAIATLSTIAALAVAGGFLAFARALRRRDPQQANDLFALGVMATASLAALALGLNFSLERGSLTIALALSALGAAYVEGRLDIPALRKAVVAMGLVIAARLLWDPRIVGDDLGTTPIFNWLLFGYGVPALCFGLAAHLLGRTRQDRAAQAAQTLAIVFSALLAFFEIRHVMTGGDMTDFGVSLSELGLYAITGFGFSYSLMRLEAGNARPVFDRFSQAFAVGATIGSAFALLLVQNPFFTGTPVEGGLVLNALLLGYAIPAAAAALLANTRIKARPFWFVRMTRLIALALTFTYVTLETRRLFHGPAIGSQQGAGSIEIYAYSAVWLALGVALLAFGLLRQSFEARVASAGVILLAVLKVFFYDLANLEGAARAFSFICLGAVLIGIGLVYQKLVFRPTARG